MRTPAADTISLGHQILANAGKSFPKPSRAFTYHYANDHRRLPPPQSSNSPSPRPSFFGISKVSLGLLRPRRERERLNKARAVRIATFSVSAFVPVILARPFRGSNARSESYWAILAATSSAWPITTRMFVTITAVSLALLTHDVIKQMPPLRYPMSLEDVLGAVPMARKS